MKSCGLSLWKILFPVILAAFLIGIIFITIIDPVSILAVKKYDHMERKYFQKEDRDILMPSSGLWLKQSNISNPEEEIIIRAKKVDKNNLEFSDVTLWFINSERRYYQRIDAESMILLDDHWKLNKVIFNDNSNINIPSKELIISTNLEPSFLMKKIINNFENTKLFSVFVLPKLISDLQKSGFSSRKFIVYYYYLLNKPFLFAAVAAAAAFFSINSTRNKNSIYKILLGLAFGLIIHITSNVILAFGSSGLIPAFASTWVITLIVTAISVLLIFEKEKI